MKSHQINAIDLDLAEMEVHARERIPAIAASVPSIIKVLTAKTGSISGTKLTSKETVTWNSTGIYYRTILKKKRSSLYNFRPILATGSYFGKDNNLRKMDAIEII